MSTRNKLLTAAVVPITAICGGGCESSADTEPTYSAPTGAVVAGCATDAEALEVVETRGGLVTVRNIGGTCFFVYKQNSNEVVGHVPPGGTYEASCAGKLGIGSGPGGEFVHLGAEALKALQATMQTMPSC